MKNRELIEWCTMRRSCYYCEYNNECNSFIVRNFITPEEAGMLIKDKIVFDENWLNSTSPGSTMTNRDLIVHCIGIGKRCFGYFCENCEAFKSHNYELNPHEVAKLILSGKKFDDEEWLESEVMESD